MIALYLLAAHLTGDFVLQTRWQAVGKFGWDGWELRTRHCLSYCIPFIPIAIIYSPNAYNAWTFMFALFFFHSLTDRQRFTSTLGDWIAWNIGTAGPPAEKRGVWAASGLVSREEMKSEFDLPPHPWPPMSILIDQTLHIIQVALLAGLLLN